MSKEDKELRALVEWISTFPLIQEIFQENPIPDKEDDHTISDWLKKKCVAL